MCVCNSAIQRKETIEFSLLNILIISLGLYSSLAALMMTAARGVGDIFYLAHEPQFRPQKPHDVILS